MLISQENAGWIILNAAPLELKYIYFYIKISILILQLSFELLSKLVYHDCDETFENLYTNQLPVTSVLASNHLVTVF